MNSNQVTETKTGKLIRFLLTQIVKAQTDLEKGKPTHALIELEYALHEADISLADSATLRNSFNQATQATK